MKKFLYMFLLLIFSSLSTFAEQKDFEYVLDGYQLSYNSYDNIWKVGSIEEDEFIFKKRFYDGAGSYSQYIDSDNKVAFTLTTNLEFVKDGVLYAINNDELKYYKIFYDGERIEEQLLTYSEIQELFPDAEIISLASIDDDNKMWIHKPIAKDKKLLFVNDSSRYFHKLKPNCIKAQDEVIKGLVTISRYGIYRFTHFGERDGKLTIYVR